MNKWIVSGAWCIGRYSYNMHMIDPIVCNSEEEAMKEMLDLVEYDLAGVDYEVVETDWNDGSVAYIVGDIENPTVVATVDSDFAHVDDHIKARYLITEVEV